MTYFVSSLATLVLLWGSLQGALAEEAHSSIRSLPVPMTTIYPGELVTSDKMTSRQFRTTPISLNGIVLDSAEVIGKEARRRLVAGKPISLSSLAAPILIQKGHSAVATYQENGLSISTPATALQDGSAGDIIKVRTAETGAVMEVEVSEDGSLLVLGQ